MLIVRTILRQLDNTDASALTPSRPISKKPSTFNTTAQLSTVKLYFPLKSDLLRRAQHGESTKSEILRSPKDSAIRRPLVDLRRTPDGGNNPLRRARAAYFNISKKYQIIFMALG